MTSPDASPAASPAPSDKPRSDLPVRLLTAALGIPLLLAVIVIGGPVYVAVVAAALALAFWEYGGAIELERNALTFAGVVAVAVLPVAAWWGDTAVTGVLAATVAASLGALIATGRIPESLTPWALTLAGVLWIGLLGEHFVGLRRLDDGRAWVLLAIFVTFATDTGAYAVGRLTGRHKLAPRLSPGKTVEGAAGGLVAGAAAAVALDLLLGLDQGVAVMLPLGAAAALVAQAGDLAESVVKRSAGVKDMGAILPGHGGVLDRLDSLLFVVPLVYYVARWAQG